LSGQLTPSLQNYILSHLSAVYEASYHPVYIREYLMRLPFGALAGKKDELLSRVRRACLKADPGAPIYITIQDFDNFEKRQHLTGLRQRPSDDVARGRIKYIRDGLEKPLIDERQREF
ncbi:hypothetical protein B0J13DRAFT_410996, partial [Dactylonectria estremocensis]